MIVLHVLRIVKNDQRRRRHYYLSYNSTAPILYRYVYAATHTRVTILFVSFD